MLYKTIYESPIGKLFLAAEDEALIGLWIEGQKYFPVKLLSERIGETELAEKDCGILVQARGWLDQYFEGDKPKPGELKLALGMASEILPASSQFRREVWKLLLEIPYGEVITYGELARRLAGRRGLSGMSPQAVGGAVGHNPLSIIIPCHRVVGTNGSLTGYAGGLEKKRRLLQLEGYVGL